jgi:phage terminase small subunit
MARKATLEKHGSSDAIPAAKRREDALTAKQQAFVDRYVGLVGETRWNAVQSALAAGYSKASVRSHSSALLRHGAVQAAIGAHLEAERARFGVLRQQLLEELTAIALTRLTDVVDFGGRQARLQPGLTPEAAAALLEVTEEYRARGKVVRRRYRLQPKVQAAALLLRHLDGGRQQPGGDDDPGDHDGLLIGQVEYVRQTLGILPPRTSAKRTT